jgi:hypothetical protein
VVSLAEWCAEVLEVELLPWQAALVDNFMPAPEPETIDLHADARGIPYALEPIDAAVSFGFDCTPGGALIVHTFSTFERWGVPSWSDPTLRRPADHLEWAAPIQ